MGRAAATFVSAIGTLSAWNFMIATALYPILMLTIVVNVTLRYGFSLGSIEFEELQWHLYGAAFLLGLPYVFRTDGDIRVDFLSRKFSAERRRRLDIIGILVLTLPFLAIFTYFAYDFFERSWLVNEASSHSSGLPARYIVKFVLFYAFANLLLQSIATLIDKVVGARHG
jgi:TRAP-type mannitol/chloroaromatic compound transport system permease small subunit